MKLHRQKSYIYEHYSEDISVEKNYPNWCICHRQESNRGYGQPFYSELPDGTGKKTAFRYIYEDCADM